MTPLPEDPDAVGAPSRDPACDALLEVAAGSQEAFAVLYDATSPRVYGLVLRVLRDPSQSEEVTQEVYLEIWRRAGSFDPARGSAIAWILTMSHRRAVDRVRSAQSQSERDVVYESKAQVEDPDPTMDAVIGTLEADRVRKALGELSGRQSEAIRLAYLGGLTHVQVAERLGIPVGTAKTRIRDGLIALRRLMTTEDRKGAS